MGALKDRERRERKQWHALPSSPGQRHAKGRKGTYLKVWNWKSLKVNGRSDGEVQVGKEWGNVALSLIRVRHLQPAAMIWWFPAQRHIYTTQHGGV